MAEQFIGREMARLLLQAMRDGIANSMVELRSHADARFDRIQEQINSTPSLSILRAEIEAVLAKMQLPQGEPGKSVTAEEVIPLLMAPIEASMARHMIDFERNLQARFERAVQSIPTPKDGEPGASIEDFAIEMKGRRLMVGMMIGGQPVTREIKLDIPLDAGVWRTGVAYEKSDVVTYSGSVFIAQCDRPSGKPGESKDWRLMVKRGRDGKDAPEGDEP